MSDHALFVIAHDAAHYLLYERRWLNDAVGRLEGVAKDLGCTLAQLAIAWCAKNPDVSTVITGASRPEQVRENMKAAEIVAKLDGAAMQRIEKATAGHEK